MRFAQITVLLAAVLCSGCMTLDHADRSNLQAHGISPELKAKMAHLQPLTLPDIVELSQHGLLPEYIIQYLHATHRVYNIADADGYRLNRQGVNTTVIAYLFATPDLMARASDRTAFFDWAPYYVPFYGGMMNTFGGETYEGSKSYVSNSSSQTDPTLLEQQKEEQNILGPGPHH